MAETINYVFMGKYIISADIQLVTALHIGGTDEGFDIGGIDNPVIKDPMTGLPYIPGSSLKGKMRSLLEWAEDQVEFVQPDNESKEWKGRSKSDPSHRICIVFGLAAEEHKSGNPPGPTRLTVLDAYPVEGQKEKWEKYLGSSIYTEAKTENVIDRLTSAAMPRSMERVPAGSSFAAEFIYDVYCHDDINRLKALFEGMRLLEDSTLGGGGSRGSGRVKFENIRLTVRDRSHYTGGNQSRLILNHNNQKTLCEILDNFNDIFRVKDKE